jgi:molybdenum-dependent DNA-binding transcriptional regulator ModE
MPFLSAVVDELPTYTCMSPAQRLCRAASRCSSYKRFESPADDRVNAFQHCRHAEMSMELHQVRYFLALCKEGSFTRAAKRCGVSQPSLSNAINSLEQELGGQLFYRGSTGCSISDLGRTVRAHMARIARSTREVSIQAALFHANTRDASYVDAFRPTLRTSADELSV